MAYSMDAPCQPLLHRCDSPRPFVSASSSYCFQIGKHCITTRQGGNVCIPLRHVHRNIGRIGSIVSLAAIWQEEPQHTDVNAEKVKSSLELNTEEPQEAWKQAFRSLKNQALRMQSLIQEAYEIYSNKAMVALAEGLEQLKAQGELNPQDAEEAWKQALDSFKDQALRMQALSQDTYFAYSKKAMVALVETSELLKIQTEKARYDLAIVAKEIAEEGKDCLLNLADNPPDEVKDIMTAFTSSADELKHVSEVCDFYVGVPYGFFLSISGFLSFMLTGDTAPIRLGVIPGAALLALSISSLRAWKDGKSSALNLTGQAAIASVVCLWHLGLLLHAKMSLCSFLSTTLSFSVAIFYFYRLWVLRDLIMLRDHDV